MAVRNDFTAGEVLAAADLNDTFASKLDLAGGKILQIVRATDSTDRSTSSATFVDANLSVTITPSKNDSAVLLFATCQIATTNASYVRLQIADASDNGISGAANSIFGMNSNAFRTVGIVYAYATPATISAVTYKLRFSSNNSGTSVTLENSSTVLAQMFAIEVSA
jgi:hypothetical protein